MDIDPKAESGYQITGNENSSICFVTLGGIRGGLGMPVFEFQKSLSHFDAMFLGLRDLKQSWYQQGVVGLGDTVASVSDQLRSITGDKKTVFVGNSMGAYAAMLFGWQCHADLILAFAPQTFMSAGLRLLHLDFRWRKELSIARRNGVKEIPDLKGLGEYCRSKTKIIYPKALRLDRIHAERLAGFQNIELWPKKSDEHRLVKLLNESGELHTIIHSNIELLNKPQ